MHYPSMMQDSPSGEISAPERVGAHADARPELCKPIVLVAEDDPDVRLMMKTLLGRRGYRVIEARDGQEAVDVAQMAQPDIILMDLQLPRLNGFAVARFMRQDERLRDTPIIVISGHDPARHQKLALAAGCDAYVQKPIDFHSLGALIVSLLPQS